MSTFKPNFSPEGKREAYGRAHTKSTISVSSSKKPKTATTRPGTQAHHTLSVACVSAGTLKKGTPKHTVSTMNANSSSKDIPKTPATSKVAKNNGLSLMGKTATCFSSASNLKASPSLSSKGHKDPGIPTTKNSMTLSKMSSEQRFTKSPTLTKKSEFSCANDSPRSSSEEDKNSNQKFSTSSIKILMASPLFKGNPGIQNQLVKTSKPVTTKKPTKKPEPKSPEKTLRARSKTGVQPGKRCSVSEVEKKVIVPKSMGQKLVESAKENNLEKCKEVLGNEENSSMDINGKDTSGNTALHYACLNGNANLVNLLIYQECLVDIENNKKETPLALSVIKGQETIVSLLVNTGASLEFEDLNGNTPIHHAVTASKPLCNFYIA